MDLGLAGKVAVVSGAGAGIGRAVAALLLEEGAHVLAVDKDEHALARLSKEKNLRCICADLALDSACAKAVSEAVRLFGGIDALVNNAGVNDGVGLDQPPEHFMASVRQNLLHVYALTHYAAESLKARKGAVVNVSSKIAETGQGNTSGYAAAKGAINALTREWAVALANNGVRVNCVVPAECATEQYERWFNAQAEPQKGRQQIEALVPLGRRLTRPEEVAAMIVLLASPRASHLTGQLIYVDGGYTHLDRAATAQRLPWTGAAS